MTIFLLKINLKMFVIPALPRLESRRLSNGVNTNILT